MAKILFIWELGEGGGHVMPYVRLISRLKDSGHEIGFVLRSLHQAGDIFHGTGVTWYQGPVVLPRHVDVVMPIDSFPKILHNAGYDRVSRLSGMIAAWRNLIGMINPDLLIFDYSPTAMLATRDFAAGRIAIGTGFHLPPDASPMPGFFQNPDDPQSRNELLKFENKVLNVINEALAQNDLRPLGHIPELLYADRKVLRTFAELDHYGTRQDADYVGVLRSPPGASPEWPHAKGPKVFAYLKQFKTLSALLSMLNDRKYPTLIYGDKIPHAVIKNASSDTLKFVDKPLDMKLVGSQADVAICNAGHGTTAEMLLSGVPLLLLPLHSEQSMVAGNVERMGAGLSAPMLRPEGMAQKLERILHESIFRTSATRFSTRYPDFNDESLLDTTMEIIDSVICEKGKH